MNILLIWNLTQMVNEFYQMTNYLGNMSLILDEIISWSNFINLFILQSNSKLEGFLLLEIGALTPGKKEVFVSLYLMIVKYELNSTFFFVSFFSFEIFTGV
jgi:hypothetical protein